MVTKKKALVVASLVGLITTLCVTGGLWLLDWYWLTPWWWPTLEVLALVLFGIALGGFCYWLMRRPTVDEDEKKRKEWREYTIRSRLQQVWRIHSRFASNPYIIPWYAHVSTSLTEDALWLQQMGFESVESAEATPEDLIALRFWVSESAVLVSFDLRADADVLTASVNELYAHLQQKRPRQMFNGVLSSVPLDALLKRNELAVADLSQRYRAVITDLNVQSGLSLPVYSVFTGMASVKDFCELFSTLDEAERDKPFGALRPLTDGVGFDSEWFAQSFDELLKKLSVTVSEALKRQLNASYRESSVAGVFQLAALKYELEDFLAHVFSQHQFDDVELKLRGYFFLNAGGDVPATDILTFMQASELGFDTLQVDQNSHSSLSLFGKNLFRNTILKESGLVGVHKHKEWRYRSSRYLVSGGLVLLFAAFVWLLKANFDYQQALDAQAIAKLEQFKENLKNEVIVRDDLASPVFSLSELRDITQLYQVGKQPWYVTRLLPDSSIEADVRKAYDDELNNVLLTLMRDYILKDMFVYNSLDDKVKTLELLNLYQVLYNPERSNVGSLVEYYISALKEEGEGDTDLLERFKFLALDVLSSGAVPPQSDPELLALVRSSLSSEDIADLLYQHIVQHEEFARRVDIRDKLNPAYAKVFEFKPGFSGYLIPYLFTREGFDDLYNETGFQLASEAIKAYEGVMGRVSGDAELSRINRQLRERYTTDYIRYWKELTSNVNWVSVSSWGDSLVQLDLATDAVFSPVSQFYSLVNTHTNLPLHVVAKKVDQDKQASETVEAGKTASTDTVQAEADTKQRVAAAIAAPFGAYHKLVEANAEGQTRLGIARAQMRQASDWIAKSKEIQRQGLYFLEQLKNSDSSNPLAQLENLANDYSDPLMPFMMKGQARTLNRLALESMRREINDDWSVIADYYQQRFSGRYPMNKHSAFDVSLTDFTEFFKQDGMVDRFETQYGDYFESLGAGNTLLKGFIPHQYANLSVSYQPFMEKVEHIQDALFTSNKLGLEFSIRAEDMTPSLTRFGIEAGASLFEYQNGPLFWRDQVWPIPSNKTQDIAVVTTDKSGATTRDKVTGHWSWFRLADKMRASTLVNSDDVSWLYSSGDNNVNLRVRVAGPMQPFAPSFFTQLTPPVAL